jgi:hypothetical protein
MALIHKDAHTTVSLEAISGTDFIL